MSEHHHPPTNEFPESPSGSRRMDVEMPDGFWMSSKLLNWLGGIVTIMLVSAWGFIWTLHTRLNETEKQQALLAQDIGYIKDGVHHIEEEIIAFHRPKGGGGSQ